MESLLALKIVKIEIHVWLLIYSNNGKYLEHIASEISSRVNNFMVLYIHAANYKRTASVSGYNYVWSPHSSLNYK